MISVMFKAGASRLPTGFLLLVAMAAHSFGGPIDLGTWYQFGFTEPGVPATGCDPNDPAGPFCPPSSGTPVTPLDAPPWTFSSLLPSFLTVTDGFLSGDQFEVFDFGISIGSTSVPGVGIDCGDDPVPCLATAGISSRVFQLAAGNHAITITPVAADFGSGFLRVDPVPEPATFVTVGAGLLVVLWRSRYRGKRRPI